MRTIAYCTEIAKRAVGKALQISPLTSPPLVAKSVTPKLLNDVNLAYFRLHGSESNTDVWFGEGEDGQKPIALRLEQIADWKLDGAVVVIANCHGSDSPFVQAFYDAGASIVMAAPGENYAAGARVLGGDMIARWILFWMRRSQSAQKALRRAKIAVRFSIRTPRYVRKDTLEFQIIKNKTEDQHASARDLK